MNLDLLRFVERLSEDEEDEVVNAIVKKRERRERAALRTVMHSLMEGTQPSTERPLTPVNG